MISCPKCNSPMVLRSGKFGQFYGCTRYPKCKGTKPFSEKPAAPQGEVKLLKGSSEQEAIWHELLHGDTHLVVNARAGTGKSFTCRQGMFRLPQHLRVGYFVFGRENRREFAGSVVPGNCEVSTFNAIGYRVCRNAFPRTQLHDDKVVDIFDELWQPKTESDNEIARLLKNAVEKLVALCQGYLVDGKNEEEVLELALRHDVELTSEIEELSLSLVPQVLEICKKRTSTVSFNDQVWLPVVLGLPCPQFDVIFVDEAQDMNRLQHAFVMRLLAPQGRVIVVGDTNQAIYGFRGSDVDSMDTMAALLSHHRRVKSLPLTVCRRCPKSAIRKAQGYVPDIRWMDDAPEGCEIETTTDKALDLYRPGDMVLCRINAPLAGIAYGLIRRGVKAIIRGREIGQGLLSLIGRLRPRDLSDLLARLDAWQSREIAKYAETRRAEAVAQRVQDQADCIRALAEGCEEVSDLKARIESIFANFEKDGQPKNAVILSSIHRAKGLESDRVFWVQPEMECKAPQAWQKQQEYNLKYVAHTRVKFSNDPESGTMVYVREGSRNYSAPSPVKSAPVESEAYEWNP